MEPHTTAHVFSCSSHPTPLIERDLWERPRFTSEFLFLPPFLYLPPFPSCFWWARELGAIIIIMKEIIFYYGRIFVLNSHKIPQVFWQRFRVIFFITITTEICQFTATAMNEIKRLDRYFLKCMLPNYYLNEKLPSLREIL